ncbi:MAG: polymer-forming cytoskeletal protein [Oligoflexia bacterium]|nr:polymer-forming cytoskeletal protein [Oligoflexia bacterium]
MSFWKKTEGLKPPVAAKTGTPNALTPGLTPPAASLPSSASQVVSAAEPVDPLQARFGKARSALGAGTVIQGKLSFDTPVRIDGKLSGEVFSSDALIVGEKGQMEAQIEVSALVVQGIVKGRITARERVVLMKGGRIEGNVFTPLFQIEEGATFNGRCSMKGGMPETRIITIEGEKEEAPIVQPAAAAPAGKDPREEEELRVH